MDVITWLLFGIIVTFTHVVEGVTGFGATVLGMPFAIMLFGVDIAKPVLTIYALVICLYIFIKNIKLVQWKDYWKMIGTLLIGLPVGIVGYNYLPQESLLNILAVFMILVSVRGLLISFGIIKRASKVKGWIALLLVFIGGIMHGAYSSGGPLIVTYATEKIKNKSQFRATLCLIWVTLNTIILCQMWFYNQLTKQVFSISLYGVPFLIISMILGNIAHRRLNQSVFMRLTYAILFTTGVVMII